ncbi:SIMPL domain-containing protein [Shewanella woodyi]|uniref:SIMPL domain-containing protein n=1 Tax=Shewanella woodyi TaxID=60961 RepID=UPI00374A4CC4
MTRIILALILLASAPFGYSANLPDFPFVVSVGNAEREVKPDIATLNLEIISFEEKSDLSLEKVSTATESVLKVLQSYGVKSEAIEATDIEKSTKRKRDSDYNRLEILGYEVSRSLTIELRDLSKYSELISDIVAIDNLSSVQTAFDASNRKDIERALVNAASIDAREKAEQMAESLNTEIHSVYAISQDSDFGSFFATFGARSDQMMASLYSSHQAHVAMFVPKNIKIRQGINVVFKIEQDSN